MPNLAPFVPDASHIKQQQSESVFKVGPTDIEGAVNFIGMQAGLHRLRIQCVDELARVVLRDPQRQEDDPSQI